MTTQRTGQRIWTTLAILLAVMVLASGCATPEPAGSSWNSSTGTLRFGDQSGGHYTEFESDGTVVQVGNAVVWEDLAIAVGQVKLPGVSDPTWTAYKGGRVLSFSKAADNEISFTAQVPHGYKEGSDMEFHLHLAYPATGTGDSRWIFTYSWANKDEDYPGETPHPADIASPNNADVHQYAEILDPIDGTGKTISSVLICSLMREGTDAVNDDYDEAIYLVSADFHYQRDTGGSRLEGSK